MRLDEKKQIAEDLNQELRRSDTIYLTDFTGLDVKAITELRSRFRAQGIRYRVVKNTLMRRALEGLDLPDLSPHLQGPTALVMSDDDPVAPAKVIKEFAKEYDDRPAVKIGIVERRVVERDAVQRLADLPPREQLLGAIAGSLTAAVGGIASVLEGLLRDIATMIEQVPGRGDSASGGESDGGDAG